VRKQDDEDTQLERQISKSIYKRSAIFEKKKKGRECAYNSMINLLGYHDIFVQLKYLYQSKSITYSPGSIVTTIPSCKVDADESINEGVVGSLFVACLNQVEKPSPAARPRSGVGETS
jgi:hypothetical protein